MGNVCFLKTLQKSDFTKVTSVSNTILVTAAVIKNEAIYLLVGVWVSWLIWKTWRNRK